MGWSGGSNLANDVWDIVEQHIPEEKRKQVAKDIVDLFREYDADDWGTCGDFLYYAAYPELNE